MSGMLFNPVADLNVVIIKRNDKKERKTVTYAFFFIFVYEIDVFLVCLQSTVVVLL